MPKFFRVKNYESLKHYSKRDAPWIKLYGSLLDNYEFSLLSDECKFHYIMILLIANNNNNKIPCDESWLRVRINSKSEIDLKKLFELGFIEEIQEDKKKNRASKTLAKRYHDDSKTLATCYNDNSKREKEEKPPFLPPSLSPAPLLLPPIIPPKEEKERSPNENFFEKQNTLEAVAAKLKPLYPGINLEAEIRKMKAWQLIPANKNRKITERFVINWLNKIDVPLESSKAQTPIPAAYTRPKILDEPRISDQEREAGLQLARGSPEYQKLFGGILQKVEVNQEIDRYD